MRWNQRDWLALLLLTMLAAALRFYKLGELPPGFHFDEAYNGLDAALILSGDRPLFLPANSGREVAYSYYQAALAALLGLDRYTLRLASALAGIATIPAGYLLLRTLLRRHSRAVAGFAMTALAVSLWHIHFSHYGIRIITMPLIYSGLFGCFWLGVRAAVPWRGGLAFALSGLLAGLAVWTHPSGRLTPVVLLAFVAYLLLRKPANETNDGGMGRWRPVIGLAITGGVSFLVFLPLGLHFLEHPEFFFTHASDVSIFNPAVGGPSPLRTGVDNTLRVAGMFTARGAASWTHNFYGRPVFDPFLAIPFLIGVALWARRLFNRRDVDRDALVLLALWALTMLATSVLSDDAPDFSRTTASQPAIFTAVGLGLTWIMLALNRRRAWLGTAVAVALLIIGGVWAVYDYFVRFPRHIEEYYTLYSVDKIEAIETLAATADEGDRLYISQLWGDFAPVRFLGDAYDITSFDIGDTVVLPPAGRGALYAFPYEQRNRAERLAALWPGATAQEIRDRFGAGLAWIVDVEAEQMADWPSALAPDAATDIGFVEGPTLRGIGVEGDMLLLFWQADASMLRDLTAFVHLIDPAGRRVGQLDRRPAGGSYATPRWRVGERVIDRYRPVLTDPCAAGLPLQAQVGWYELAADGLRRPRADGLGELVYAGELSYRAEPLTADALDDAAPHNQSLGAGAELAAVRLDAADVEPGAPLALDLFWRVAVDGPVPHAVLTVENGSGKTELWRGPAVARDTWQVGDLYCRRIYTRLPADAAPGEAALRIGVGDQIAKIQTLTILPSTRVFVLPELTRPVDANFDEAIHLAGVADVDQIEDSLHVTLVWQSRQPVATDYQVFVHVVDAGGQIVAQSDQRPGEASPTSGWLVDEVTIDAHEISLPAGAGPIEELQLRIGLYDPVSGARLPVAGPGAGSAQDNAVHLPIHTP